MRKALRIALYLPLGFLLLQSSLSFGQNGYYLNTGVPAQSTMYPVKLGAVNLDNGNLFLKIPLVSFAERAGPPAQLSLVYNSTFWDVWHGAPPDGGDVWYPYSQGGLSLVVDYGLGSPVRYQSAPNPCNQSGYTNGGGAIYSNFYFTDANGTTVTFTQIPPLSYMICYSGTNQFVFDGVYNQAGMSDNATGYYLQEQLSPTTFAVTYKLYGPDGSLTNTTLTTGDFVGEDSNGNVATQVIKTLETDQLGRNAISSSGPGNTTCPTLLSSSGSTYQLPGTTPSETCTTIVQTDVGEVQLVMHYATVDVCTNFPTPPFQNGNQLATQYCGTASSPTPINLPSSMEIIIPGEASTPTYTFGYDAGTSPGHYGELTSLTLPQGGTLKFSYVPTGVDPCCGVAGSAEQIHTVSDGDGTTTFQLNTSVGSPGPATVLLPAHLDPYSGSSFVDSIVYSAPAAGFWPNGCSPCTLKYYRNGATLLKTVTRNVDQYHRVTSQVTTLNDTGQTATASYQYSPNTRLVSQEQEGDFSGSILRTTVTSYLQDTSSIHYVSQYHMLNRPLSVAVYPGATTSGTPSSLTRYTYDEYSAGYCKNNVPGLATITGAAGHDDTRDTTYLARGNPTTVSRLIGSTNYSTSHMCYDTLGNVTQSVDANRNPTSYIHTDHFADSQCTTAGPTYAFPTTVTNAAGQTEQLKYFICSGRLQSDEDPNLATTTYAYDGLGRPTTIGYPDGGSLANTYVDSPGSSSVTQTQALTATASKTIVTLLDGLARTSETQLTTDPWGIYVDYSYDSQGRQATQTNPYRKGDTIAVQSLLYDSLGRLGKKTQPDLSTQTWVYSGNNVTFTNENTKSWVRNYDAFGRLATVLEPGVNGNPTSETDYSYSLLDNLTAVKQCGAACPANSAVNRQFSYDALSRLIQSYNPEAGWTCYGTSGGAIPNGSNCTSGYDSDGNLLYKTDARAVTVNYKFDGLNRLLSKTYSNDGNKTPSSCFQYDSAAVTNGKGRLSSEWTQSASAGACAATPPSTGLWSRRSVLAYDAMGRMLSEQQCTPSNCSNGGPYEPTYSYDLAGDPIGSTNGITSTPVVNTLSLTNLFDQAGRQQGVESNWVDPTHPSSLYSAQTASAEPCSSSQSYPFAAFGGLLNASFGGGLTLNRSYDVRLRTTCETDTGGLLKNATSASAAVTVTGQEQSK